jgi:hypothetical protein
MVYGTKFYFCYKSCFLLLDLKFVSLVAFICTLTQKEYYDLYLYLCLVLFIIYRIYFGSMFD